MKKSILATVLISSLLLSGTALAKFSDEYKAQHPKDVIVKTTQTKSGKMSTFTQYKIFKAPKLGGLGLTVNDMDGIKLLAISYSYSGKFWRFYDGFSWGDGKEAHDVKLFIKPNRSVGGGRVVELITALVNPTEMKTAVVVHAHSDKGGNEIIMNAAHPRWKEWKEALDVAEKLLSENNIKK